MNENERLDVGVALVCDWVELGGVAALLDPGDLEGWPVLGRSSHSVEIPDVRSGGNIRDPAQLAGSW